MQKLPICGPTSEKDSGPTGFLSLNDLAAGQEELALALDFLYDTQELSVIACALLPEDTNQNDIAVAYISLCDLDSISFDTLFLSHSDILDYTLDRP